MISSIKNILLGLALILTATSVNASPVAYPNVGVENSDTYTFKAASTGDIIAYFAGSTASYINTLGLIVNGIDTGKAGLNNHTSHYGDMFNFGHVTAGDSLVFKLNVLTKGTNYFSDKGLNPDGVNHIFSNFYSGDSKIHAGTYVAFEDLKNGGDFNYHDENFVFSNVASTVIPVPAAVWLFGSALLGLVGIGKSKRKQG